MKLSIIIPVFNGEKYIKKAYASILNQDLEFIEHEIIFINNNSTDNSIALINELIVQDEYIKVYNQPIQGEAHARNLGIKLSKGDYIYQLDVDDEIFPNVLLTMVKALDDFPKVMAVFGKMYKSYQPLADVDLNLKQSNDIQIFDPPEMGLKWFKSLRYVVGPPGFMYRKIVFEKIGLYNVDLVIGTDTAMDIKLGMQSSVAYIDTYIYLYFKHSNSSLQTAKGNGGLIFHTWNRLVKEHLPFYLKSEVPNQFKNILFRNIYRSLGKLIYYTKGLSNRKKKYLELKGDINPLIIPFYLKSWLILLIYMPWKPFLKFYIYFLSKIYLNKILKSSVAL